MLQLENKDINDLQKGGNEDSSLHRNFHETEKKQKDFFYLMYVIFLLLII